MHAYISHTYGHTYISIHECTSIHTCILTYTRIHTSCLCRVKLYIRTYVNTDCSFYVPKTSVGFAVYKFLITLHCRVLLLIQEDLSDGEGGKATSQSLSNQATGKGSKSKIKKLSPEQIAARRRKIWVLIAKKEIPRVSFPTKF